MAKTKPPKLDLGTCEDKKEAVELWLDQFNDWCILCTSQIQPRSAPPPRATPGHLT
jgi:hypothetical protein